MKNYLNSNQLNDFYILSALIDESKEKLQLWINTDNLTQEEVKYFKMGTTFLVKTFDLVIKRMDIDTIKRIDKKYHNETVVILDNYANKLMDKKLNNKIDQYKEVMSDYYDLLEVVFEKTCKGCSEHSSKCNLASLLTKMSIAEYDEKHHENKNCKYSYK